MKSLDDWIYLIAGVCIVLALLLGGGYYFVSEQQKCVSDPMGFLFGNESEQIRQIVENSTNLKICTFNNKMDMIPTFCIDIKK